MLKIYRTRRTFLLQDACCILVQFSRTSSNLNFLAPDFKLPIFKKAGLMHEK